MVIQPVLFLYMQRGHVQTPAFLQVRLQTQIFPAVCIQQFPVIEFFLFQGNNIKSLHPLRFCQTNLYQTVLQFVTLFPDQNMCFEASPVLPDAS